MLWYSHILTIAVLLAQIAFLKSQIVSKNLQNKLAHVLLSANIGTPISGTMSILCWDKLHERQIKQLLVIVFKCLHHNAPSYLSSQFIFTSSIHSRCTRSQSCNTLVLPFWNNNQGKQTFYYRGTSMWNRLSPEIRSKLTSMSLNMFRVVLQSGYIFKNYIAALF